MIYFISDIHLGLYARNKDKERENLLLSFLDSIIDDCDELFIVGDLFDYWFEYKWVIPKYYYRTLTMISKFRDKGINIEYLMGNHDFGHETFFQEEFGINIHMGDIEREIEGKKFFISHGDGKAFNDIGYKILKKILRNPLSLKLFKCLHPTMGINLASTSSNKSRKYTDSKTYGHLEGLEDFSAKKILEGFDYVVMGHRHKAINKQIGNGYYVNLGDWVHEPTFGRYSKGEFELLEVRSFLNI
jgi:UDP-2,3-diacylglucosamine hydrolase